MTEATEEQHAEQNLPDFIDAFEQRGPRRLAVT